MLGIVLLAVGAAYLFAARTIPLDDWLASETINARTLPTIYAVALMLLTLAWMSVAPAARVIHGPLARPLALVAVMLLFAYLVPRTSLWLAVPTLLGPSLWIMGERRAVMIAVVPCAVAVAGWLLTESLELYLPDGRWWQ